MFPNQFRTSKNGKPEKVHNDICNLMGGGGGGGAKHQSSVEGPMKRKIVGGFMHIIHVSLDLLVNCSALWCGRCHVKGTVSRYF